MNNKEKLKQLSVMIEKGKKLLNEAAAFATENDIDFTLDLYGAEFNPERIDFSEDGEEAIYDANFYKRYGINQSGESIWVNSSTFC